MARPNSITMVQAIEKILTRVDGPMPVDAFIKRVLAMYRSTAKNPIASVRNKLRTECVGENIVSGIGRPWSHCAWPCRVSDSVSA